MLSDFENAKRKLAAENADLLRQLQELENNANMLSKIRAQIQSQLRMKLKELQTVKLRKATCSFKNLKHELDGMKEHLAEDVSSKDDVFRKLQKASQEADLWRQKYEQDGLAKLEMSKMKLQARLTEAQGTNEQLDGKLMQVEKARATLQAEVEEMSQQTDQSHILNNAMEKKSKQFDRIVGEWKAKVDSMAMDLDNAQKEWKCFI